MVAALRAMSALGASVTLPHKLAVAALCDELSPAAKAIGAVNCLQFGDRLVGHNTDCDGFLDASRRGRLRAPRQAVGPPRSGRAARAVAYGLRGGRAIEVIARGPDEVDWAQAWPWTDGEFA